MGNLSSKPERDVLMQDFYVVESIFFPRYVAASAALPPGSCPSHPLGKKDPHVTSALLASHWPESVT